MKMKKAENKNKSQRSLMIPLVIMTNIVSLAAVVTIMTTVKTDNDPWEKEAYPAAQTSAAAEVKDTSVPTPKLPLTLSSKPKSAQNTQSRTKAAASVNTAAQAQSEQKAEPKELKPEEKKVIKVEVVAPEKKTDTSKQETPRAIPAVPETQMTTADTEAAVTPKLVSQTPVSNAESASPYAGIFVVDESAGIHSIVSTTGSDGQCSVIIRLPVREHTFVEWSFSGSFNDEGIMFYTNGNKTVKYVDEWGEDIEPSTTYFTDGSGWIKVTDEGLSWQENVENTGADLFFARVIF
ncbi:MAG: hypothetical protein IJM87_02125 [Ruminococcus sp.]|nr:hypothetical protein [Ruminococcus sp.]